MSVFWLEDTCSVILIELSSWGCVVQWVSSCGARFCTFVTWQSHHRLVLSWGVCGCQGEVSSTWSLCRSGGSQAVFVFTYNLCVFWYVVFWSGISLQEFIVKRWLVGRDLFILRGQWVPVSGGFSSLPASCMEKNHHGSGTVQVPHVQLLIYGQIGHCPQCECTDHVAAMFTDCPVVVAITTWTCGLEHVLNSLFQKSIKLEKQYAKFPSPNIKVTQAGKATGGQWPWPWFTDWHAYHSLRTMVTGTDFEKGERLHTTVENTTSVVRASRYMQAALICRQHRRPSGV